MDKFELLVEIASKAAHVTVVPEPLASAPAQAPSTGTPSTTPATRKRRNVVARGVAPPNSKPVDAADDHPPADLAKKPKTKRGRSSKRLRHDTVVSPPVPSEPSESSEPWAEPPGPPPPLTLPHPKTIQSLQYYFSAITSNPNERVYTQLALVHQLTPAFVRLWFAERRKLQDAATATTTATERKDSAMDRSSTSRSRASGADDILEGGSGLLPEWMAAVIAAAKLRVYNKSNLPSTGLNQPNPSTTSANTLDAAPDSKTTAAPKPIGDSPESNNNSNNNKSNKFHATPLPLQAPPQNLLDPSQVRLSEKMLQRLVSARSRIHAVPPNPAVAKVVANNSNTNTVDQARTDEADKGERHIPVPKCTMVPILPRHPKVVPGFSVVIAPEPRMLVTTLTGSSSISSASNSTNSSSSSSSSSSGLAERNCPPLPSFLKPSGTNHPILLPRRTRGALKGVKRGPYKKRKSGSSQEPAKEKETEKEPPAPPAPNEAPEWKPTPLAGFRPILPAPPPTQFVALHAASARKDSIVSTQTLESSGSMGLRTPVESVAHSSTSSLTSRNFVAKNDSFVELVVPGASPPQQRLTSMSTGLSKRRNQVAMARKEVSSNDDERPVQQSQTTSPL